MFLDRFENIYKSFRATFPENLENLLPNKIIDLYNKFLCSISTKEETSSTIRPIPSSKSSKPDDFTSFFYKHYWKNVKTNFIVAIKISFVHGHLLEELNHTLCFNFKN